MFEFREPLQWQKPEALYLSCMTEELLIYCCHDNRHKVCGEDGLKDQTRGGVDG